MLNKYFPFFGHTRILIPADSGLPSIPVGESFVCRRADLDEGLSLIDNPSPEAESRPGLVE